MSIMVSEDLHRSRERFSDPSALLSCDNPDCYAPWVAAAGLVVWALSGNGPVSGLFTERLLIGCNAHCLQRAQARHRLLRWSEPVTVGEWFDFLHQSIATDPQSIEIGEYARTA